MDLCTIKLDLRVLDSKIKVHCHFALRFLYNEKTAYLLYEVGKSREL